MSRNLIRFSICTLVLMALVAAPAFAQSPVDSYSSTPIPAPAGTSATYNGPSAPATTTRIVHPSSNHRLPFTGVDIRLIGLGGITLLGAGFVLRRRTRPSVD